MDIDVEERKKEEIESTMTDESNILGDDTGVLES